MLSMGKRRAIVKLQLKAEALQARTVANQRRVINALESANSDMLKVLEGYERIQQELKEVLADE